MLGAVSPPTVTATVGNSSGAGTVNLTVTDNVTKLTASTSFTVNAAALPAFLSPIANETIAFPGSSPAVGMSVNDPGSFSLFPFTTGGDLLSFSATSDNEAVVSDSSGTGIVFGNTQIFIFSFPNITVTPSSTGTAHITVTATDTVTGLSASTTFTVLSATVPTISAVSNQTVKIPGSSSALSFQVSDAATAANLLTVTATSDTEAVVGDGSNGNPNNIAFTGTGKYRHVTITPQSVGTANITLTVTDGAGLTATSTFAVTADTAPSITSISNQTVNLPGQSGWQPYTVSDAVTPAGNLTVTTASSNTTVVPSTSVVLHTVGSYNFVSVAPAAVGTSLITLTVTNQYGFTATTEFTVTAVSGVTITSVSNQTVVVGSATAALPVTLGGAGGDPLTLAATSGSISVVPNSAVVVGGTAPNFTVTVTPATIGTSLITLTGTDPLTGATATTEFSVTAISGPTLSGLSAQVLTPGATGPTQTLTVTDAVNPSGPFTVSYYSKNNTVLPKSGIAVVSATPNTYSVTVTPIAYGTATVVVTVTDTGTGLSANEQFVVTVAAAPTISTVSNQGLAVNTSTSALPVTLTGPAGDALVLTSSSANTTVVPNPAVVLAGSLDSYTVVVTPAATGSSVITLTVTDTVTTLSATSTFTVTSGSPVTVSGLVNEVTSLSIPGPPANQYFTVADASNPNGPFTVTSTSTNTSLVPNDGAFVVHTPSVAGQPFTLATEAYNIAGSTTITVKVTDNATHVSGIEQFVFTQANSPTVSTPSNQTVPVNTSTSALPVTLTGPSGDPLVLTSSSANTTVVPNNAVILTGSGTSYTVVATPASTGSSVITLTVTDSTTGLTATSTFTVNATAVSVSVANTSVVVGPNNNVNATFTVTLASASASATALTYATSNGTATSGTDYTAKSGTLSIPAGATSGTVTVSVLAGTTDASGLTFNLGVSNQTTGNASGICTINHDTAPVAVSVTPLPTTTSATLATTFTSTVSDTAGTGDIASTILTIGSGGTTLKATYASGLLYLSTGSSLGTGYAPGSATVITTSLGSLNCVNTTVTASGNNLVIAWNLTPASGLVGVQQMHLYANTPWNKSSGTVAFGNWTIVAYPTLSVANTSVIVGPNNAVNAVFTISVSPVSTKVVTVNYATSNGTASAGTDYTAKSGTLSLAAGASSGTVTVSVLAGTTDASGLVFNLGLSSPANAAVGTSPGTCTINHDTAPVAVSLTPLPSTTQANVATTFTSTVSDTAGTGDIASTILTIGSGGTILKATYASGLLYLYTGSTPGTGYAPGSGSVITTSLGSLNCAGTTVTTSGNNLVIAWNLTPASGLVGVQQMHLYANTAWNKSSGTVAFGNWTITASGTLQAFSPDASKSPLDVTPPTNPSLHSS